MNHELISSERADRNRQPDRQPDRPQLVTCGAARGPYQGEMGNTLLGVQSWVRFCQQEFWELPRLMGRYCSYLLPKQAGGTPQIIVDKTSPMTGRLRVYPGRFFLLCVPAIPECHLPSSMFAQGESRGRRRKSCGDSLLGRRCATATLREISEEEREGRCGYRGYRGIPCPTQLLSLADYGGGRHWIAHVDTSCPKRRTISGGPAGWSAWPRGPSASAQDGAMSLQRISRSRG